MLYIKYFMLAGVLPVFSLFLVGWYIQPVSGDLTRLGNLSERDFGWNAMQQQISIKKSDQTRQPNVVVIGDSFSLRNIWQSIAEDESQLTFTTFDWSSFSNNVDCMEEWVATLKELYPSCNFVLLETIERDFLGRFHSKNAACANKTKNPVVVKPGRTESVRTLGINNTMPDPVYAVQSLFNSLHEFKKNEKRKDVFVAPLTRPGLFSNKRSDLLLYYENDAMKKDWQKDAVRKAVDKAKRLQQLAENKGIRLIYVIVPDKSTTYASYFRYPPFPVEPPDVWNELAAREVNQVDLKQALRSAVTSNQDLYLPNDTHVGSTGYILIGKAIAARLKEFGP